MKFSEYRIMRQLRPWVRKMQQRSSAFTLVGNGIHFKNFKIEHLDYLDQTLGGRHVILLSRFTDQDGTDKIYYLSVGPDAHTAWEEYCKATNLLLPTLARRAINPVSFMQDATRFMNQQQREIQEDHKLLLPHFKWEPKDERINEDEYNYLFNGAIVFKDGKMVR